MKVGVYAAVAATAVVAVYLYNAHFDTFFDLTLEDHLVEWTQFWLVLAASVLMFVAWARTRFRRWFTLGYALVFFVVAGEEIDWGDRIWGNGTIGDPNSKGLNEQGELNLHNIRGVHEHQRLVGLMIFLGIAFVIPLTYRFWPLLREWVYDRFDVPISPIWAMPIALVALAFQFVPRAFLGGNILGFDEMGELYTYLVFLIVALDTVGSTFAPARRPAGPSADEVLRDVFVR